MILKLSAKCCTTRCETQKFPQFCAGQQLEQHVFFNVAAVRWPYSSAPHSFFYLEIPIYGENTLVKGVLTWLPIGSWLCSKSYENLYFLGTRKYTYLVTTAEILKLKEIWGQNLCVRYHHHHHCCCHHHPYHHHHHQHLQKRWRQFKQFYPKWFGFPDAWPTAFSIQNDALFLLPLSPPCHPLSMKTLSQSPSDLKLDMLPLLLVVVSPLWWSPMTTACAIKQVPGVSDIYVVHLYTTTLDSTGNFFWKVGSICKYSFLGQPPTHTSVTSTLMPCDMWMHI